MTTVLSRVGQTLEHRNLGQILTQPSARMNILLKILQEEDLYIHQELVENQKALQRQDHPVRVTRSTHESAPQLGDRHTHLEEHQLGDLPLPLKLTRFGGQHILQALQGQDHPVKITRSTHDSTSARRPAYSSGGTPSRRLPYSPEIYGIHRPAYSP